MVASILLRFLGGIAATGIVAWPVIDGASAIAQTPEAKRDRDADGQAMVRMYQEAREAFARQDWESAAQRFRDVSRMCSGSPLALESNYFAMLADWKRHADNAPETMANWLAEARAIEDRMRTAQRAKPPALAQWVANTHLLLAQIQRGQRQYTAAEERLQRCLGQIATDPDSTWAWPSSNSMPSPSIQAAMWFELGILAREHRQDESGACECFERAASLSEESSELQCQALGTLAQSRLSQSSREEAIAAIERLERSACNNSWRTHAALLRHQLARSHPSSEAIADPLRGAVPWALDGTLEPPLQYELAVALSEAGDQEHATSVLRHLVKSDPAHPLAVEARVRLARIAVQQRAWVEARELLDQAIALGCPQVWVPHARFARGEALLALGAFDAAHDDLSLALELVQDDATLETAIRCSLAESLMQLQRWDEANDQWKILDERYQNDNAPPPPWMARVWLHQAEMQALRQNWTEVEGIVSRIRSQFPKCDCSDDVDYIRARWLISKARFDEARQLLAQIAGQQTVRSPELSARARWMTGETFLMQRRYAEALRGYQSVLETESSAYWQSAARMQMGQCHELMGDASAARQAYQAIADRYADGPFGELAQQKLATLETSTTPQPPGARTSNDMPAVKQR